MTVPYVLRLVALAAAACAAAIGFVAGFASYPELNYPWALPIIGALLGVGLGLRWLADVVRTG